MQLFLFVLLGSVVTHNCGGCWLMPLRGHRHGRQTKMGRSPRQHVIFCFCLIKQKKVLHHFCFGSLQDLDQPYQRIGKAGRKSAISKVLQCRLTVRNVQCHSVWRAWCFVSALFCCVDSLARGCFVVVLCLRACLCSFWTRVCCDIVLFRV